MIIRKEDAVKIENSKSCTVYEYFLGSEKVGIAKALINGRYPEEGSAMNEECDQIYFCTSGRGSIHCNGQTSTLEKDGAFLFKTGAPYWVEGDKLEVIVTNGPPFNPKQYKKLKD